MNSRNFTKEQIAEAINSTHSVAEAVRYLGCSRDTLVRNAKKFGVKLNLNQGGRGVPDEKRSAKTADEAFQKDSKATKGILVYWLKQEREWKCECCGLTEWQGKRLPLEVHHINGDRTDQRRENLQILCPNCHSLTENWRARSKGKSKDKQVSDEELIETIKCSKNIYRTLKKLNLSGGANYFRVQKLLAKEYLKEAK